MLTCKDLVEISSDLLDDQLSVSEKVITYGHLLRCRDCRRFLRQLRLARMVIKALPESCGDPLAPNAKKE